MSDDKAPKGWSKFIQENIKSSGDVGVFLLGTAAGVAIDVLSMGVSLKQGTMFGGAAALGAKKSLEGTLAKRRLTKRVKESADYYRDVSIDIPKADAFDELLLKIKNVKSMKADEIAKDIDKIEKS